MIKAVIFDVGGVLLRTYDWTGRHSWDKKLGLATGTAEHTVFNSPLGTAAQMGAITTEALWQGVGEQFALSAADLAQFRRDFWAGDQFDTELLNYIRRLRPQYQTAIISNAPDDLRTVLTHEFAAADAFDLIVVSAEEKLMKPSAEIYLRTLERLGRTPAEAIFVDDSPTNVAGAEVVGMAAVRYTPGCDLPALLVEYGISPV